MRATPLAALITLWIGSASVSSAQDINCNLPIPSGASTADINSCLQGGKTIVLQDGGLYDIDEPLVIVQDGTILKGETEGDNRPTLRGTPRLHDHMLKAESINSFELSYVVFDGNLSNRLTQSDGECHSNPDLGNILLAGGSAWVVDHVASVNAICHSAMEASGSNFEIAHSTFSNNGRDINENPNGYWSDGLTVWQCNQSHIYENVLQDNTDIDLIVGGGQGCLVEDNTIINEDKHAFAGLNVGWFPNGNGDHSGSTYRNNTIESGPGQMAFGLVVGQEPWWHPAFPDMFVPNAGTITENSISGAVVNLAIDGIGAGYIHGNTAVNSWGTFGFFCRSVTANYTAHYFGAADIDGGWAPWWFYAQQWRTRPYREGCGTWNPSLPQPDNPGALVHSRYIPAGGALWSDDGQYHLEYQAADGNLVLYDANWNVVDNFNIPHPNPNIAVMQSDGNFVVYDSTFQARFDTHTAGNEGADFVVQGDGNVVIYDLSGTPLWSIF
jgi:hypothetical protein